MNADPGTEAKRRPSITHNCNTASGAETGSKFQECCHKVLRELTVQQRNPENAQDASGRRNE
jgi:hypothetical protein